MWIHLLFAVNWHPTSAASSQSTVQSLMLSILIGSHC